MSARGRGRRVVERSASGDYDFVIVNFANPDMVGHTGVLPAAVSAVEAVDAGLGAVVDAVRETAAPASSPPTTATPSRCSSPTARPHTAHTTNPVPLIVTASAARAPRRRHLADVAPTMLELLGIPQPGDDGSMLNEVRQHRIRIRATSCSCRAHPRSGGACCAQACWSSGAQRSLVHSGLPPVHRLAGWLVAEDRRAEVTALMEWVATLDGPHRGPRTWRPAVARRPALGGRRDDGPAEALALRDHEV